MIIFSCKEKEYKWSDNITSTKNYGDLDYRQKEQIKTSTLPFKTHQYTLILCYELLKFTRR